MMKLFKKIVHSLVISSIILSPVHARPSSPSQVHEEEKESESDRPSVQSPLIRRQIPVEQESFSTKMLKLTGNLVKTGVTTTGMMTVYSQGLVNAEIDLAYVYAPVMISAGCLYAMTDYFGPCYEERNKVPVAWKASSLLSALFPVGLLLDAEMNHHKVSGNEGWDEYFTYFMAVAPFVLYHEFKENHIFGSRYFMDADGEMIHEACNAPDTQIMAYREDMEKNGYYIPLANRHGLHQESLFRRVAPWIASAVNTPFSYFAYRSVANALLPDFDGKTQVSSTISVFLVLSSFLIQKEMLDKEKLDLIHLPSYGLGLFCASPYILQGLQASKKMDPAVGGPALAFFSLMKVMEKGNSIATTVKNLWYRSSRYAGTPQQERLLLRDKLQKL